MQEDEGGKRYPARFGSITLNDREWRYSQAKLELFGLFRALHDVRLHIFGPNATINRWITSILLFNFKLVHVPAAKHAAPDGLSRRPKAEEDPEVDEEEYEDWVDECGAFTVELMNRRDPKSRLLHPTDIPPSEYYSPNTLPQDVAIFTTTEILPGTSESEIPRSKKAKKRDERLEVMREFLETKKPPDGLEEKEIESLVQLAT
ncbi:hypothetical protein PISMIDRAFT_18852 [Pisolithus microcarpus 441]|uniref:Unplaced genomic scaffold scaffold_414, whole genome shotgun sequence n=1 Tax=Pisolithus microcarpus 441 TaxID=765257 RepID=A0A0C9YEG1_9AGAM|nr:hypothetical protein PISMIDRAFT_18852 [Pisolithus microcarpus 441]